MFIALATAGSAALLLGAWGFQYLGDLAPCKMCIWQRWPHGVAVVAGLLWFIWRAAWLPVLGLLGALATAAIGGYHTGVERGWWEGPASCSGGDVGNLTTDELLDRIMTAPLVRCDEVAWEMLSLSMASWNMVLSLGLACFWVMALQRKA